MQVSLWVDAEVQEVMDYYSSIFKNTRQGVIDRYNDAGPGKPGTAVTGEIEIEGMDFVILNGGPDFKPNEAVSIIVTVYTQEEVDYYWNALTKDGEESMCGWLKDKYGFSWQIVPERLNELFRDSDPKRAAAATAAMLKMQKLDIAELEAAADSAN